MKNKISIISLSFTIIVMAALLLQSFHSFHHLEEFVAEKHCHHKYNHHKTEVSHAHEGFDHCFACEFTFSNFISPTKISFTVPKVQVLSKYSFYYSKEITQSFRGSLFALRAPPIVTV
ncbi:MAG TPA: hypothetical protein PKN96_02190 [Flavobacterium sp.]|uniref:hypothetical protein n=1 Tax=Flavobacterium sp. TaxID=239 RepID=UPI002C7AE84A|nr:hypothetical protein [Flavobacterium sp.]HNP32083.1 hypothetical protein [Flavobacterium sp.]